MKMWWRMAFLALFWGQTAVAQEEAPLVTYGPGAAPVEGDEDSRQTLIFRLPRDTSGRLFLRLFDGDCGGSLDDPAGGFDTRTAFRLLRGESVSSEEDVLKSLELADSPLHDGRWATLAEFSAADGEVDGEMAVFRLEVEGLTGDDANVFKVAVSREEKRNVEPPGLELFSYEPSLRLERSSARAEISFLIPQDAAQLKVQSFDLAGARLTLDTALRSDVLLPSSGQGEWDESVVEFRDAEKGRRGALILGGGGEVPNDATFRVVRMHGEPLPIALPIYVRPANQRPVPRATTLPLADCRTVIFDGSASEDLDGDALKFFWDFGDGEQGRGRRTRHTYGTTGSFHAALRLEDDSGQVTSGATLSIPLTVNLPPRAVAKVDRKAVAPGEALRFDASQSVDQDGEIERYIWDFGDGTREGGQVVSHTYRESGHFTVTLRAEDDSDSPCNVGGDELEVWVNGQPALEIGSDRKGSPRQNLVFEPARIRDSDGEIVRYVWDFGDGTVEAGRRVEHAFEAPGTYRVTLTVSDDAGVANSSAEDQLSVRINDRPVAVAGPTQQVAVHEPVAFDGRGARDPDGEIVAWRWEFGDGAAAEGVRVTHAYDEPGRYQARLTVRDDSTTTSETASDTVLIVVNHPPRARAGDGQQVSTSEVRFDGRGSDDPDGEIIAWFWDFGDGTTGTGATPHHVYRRPGSYTVRLTVRDDSGTRSHENSDSLQVLVNALPLADVGKDRVAAPGEVLTFDGVGSLDPDGEIVRYVWDFGDGITAEGRTVTHAYPEAGTYMVGLTVHDDTGHWQAVDDDRAIVRVNGSPTALAGHDILAAPGDEVVLDGSRSYDSEGGPLQFRWDLSEGGRIVPLATSSPASEQLLRHRFERPGIYRATLHVEDNSGARNSQHSDQVKITINHPPQARSGADLFGCDSTLWFDGSTSVDPDGDPLTYLWDFGDGTPPVRGARVRHTYRHAGVFPVLLTVDDGRRLSNSTSTSASTVTINHPPVAAAGDDRVVCAGIPVLLSGSGSGDPEGGPLQYRWDFGDGTIAEGVNPTKIYHEGGMFPVTLTVRDDSGLACDFATDIAILQVAESPLANAGDDQEVCLGSPVFFDGSQSRDFVDTVVNQYSWDFGDGEIGGGVSPVHTYQEPGEYEVVLTITGDQVVGCDATDDDVLAVIVREGPLARIDGPEQVMPGVAAQFTADASSSTGGEIVSWHWDFGDGSKASGRQVSHVFQDPGEYRVQVAVSTEALSCQTATAEKRVVANAPPRAVAGKDRLAGVSDLLLFSGVASEDPDGTLVAYEWDFGDGTTASGLEVRHRYHESGRFPVTLEVRDATNLANGRAQDSLEVVVNAAPQPVIEAPEGACVGEEVRFSSLASQDADGEIVSSHWNFGDGTEGPGVEAVHRFLQAGTYQVTLTVDDGSEAGNGKAVVSHNLRVNQPPRANPGRERRVCPDEEVIFDGSASTDPDGEIATYRWDLGDGTEALTPRVVHSYAAPGAYPVLLDVKDGSATNCSLARAYTSVVVNAAPIVRLEVPPGPHFTGGVHDAVVFDATASEDPDGDFLSYHWDFGDGGKGRGARVRHTYTEPGTYTVELRLDDGSATACGKTKSTITLEVLGR